MTNRAATLTAATCAALFYIADGTLAAAPKPHVRPRPASPALLCPARPVPPAPSTLPPSLLYYPQSSSQRIAAQIVYILSDNLGWGNVAYHRRLSPTGPSPEVVTPNLDRLVASGIELDRFYTYKFCSPSRSSLMTGRFAQHVNMHNLALTVPRHGIPLGMTTIASKLKSVGCELSPRYQDCARAHRFCARVLHDFCPYLWQQTLRTLWANGCALQSLR